MAAPTPTPTGTVLVFDLFTSLEALETDFIANANLPIPNLPQIIQQVQGIRAERLAANAEYVARRYQSAADKLFATLTDATRIYARIRDQFVARGFPTTFPDDASLSYNVLIHVRRAECFTAVGDYAKAEQSITGALVDTALPVPVQRDQALAYLWLTAATVFSLAGDQLYRNDDAAIALNEYTKIINPDRTEPSTSILYTNLLLKPAADTARKVIANFNDLIAGKTTAGKLGVDPNIAGVMMQVSERLAKINAGLDFWGHHATLVPIWTFDYLQGVALTLAQLATSAERDYITFQQRSDEASATSQQLSQLVAQASAEVDAAHAQAAATAAEALAYAQGADLARQRATDARRNADEYAQTSSQAIQLDAMRSQIGGGDGQSPDILNAIADTFMAGGKPNASDDLNPSSDLYGVYSRNNVAAGAQLASAKLSQQYEVDSLQRTANQMNAAAAQAATEAAAAQARVTAANAAIAVATLHAEAAQQNLQAFDSQTFTPDVWQRMADTMFRLYRRYLDMALKAALLMQQAYNFETDQSLTFIKKDYSTVAVQGLLGADALIADIESFSYDLITSTTGKPQPVRQTISLAQRYAFLFERQFRRTGIMEFETRIDDFDYVYPGTYAGRIESVGVEVVGLVPPNGVSGNLTNSGISAYRTPPGSANADSQGLKYRLQPRETLVLSDYAARVDSSLVPTDRGIRGIFQGAGLVSSWRLELPPEVNDIDYGALLDVRLTFYYKARYDPDLHDQVIAELRGRPSFLERQRGIPLRWLYPDAFFRFQDTGVLSFRQSAQDFASNETRPVITGIGIALTTDGTVSPQGLVVRLKTPGKTEASAAANANGFIDSATAGSAWASLVGNTALGDYTITMAAADNPALVTGGNLNLSPIVNIALVLSYRFSPKTSDGARKFSTVDFVSASSTIAQSINDVGQIAGAQRDANGVYHSVATDLKSFSRFDPPAGGIAPPVTSIALGINGKGEIVGFAGKNDIANPAAQAYIKRGDAFTFFSHPNADPAKGTQLGGINNAGLRVGTFTDTAGRFHGFLQDDQTTTVLESLPDMPANQGSWLSGVNNQGQMVGGYFDTANKVQHGLWTDGKQFRTVDFAGTDITFLNDINDAGQMAGANFDSAAQVFRGFVTDGKTFTTVDYPNLPKGFGTFVTGIDNKGRLVGYYGPEIGLEGSLGAKAAVHGFLAEPISNVAASGALARATLKPLQAPQASTSVTPATDASQRRRR
jgi:hypothetical protein